MRTDRAERDAARRRTVEKLLAMRDGAGTWTGQLSDSAVATATAVGALQLLDAAEHGAAIRLGRGWLVRHRNADGGWGDTPESPSNLAATLLGQSALLLSGGDTPDLAPADAWLRRAGAEPNRPATLAAALRARYGGDRTFAVPILAFYALAAERTGGPDCWPCVPRLPVELGLLPHGLLRSVRLPVVSYALPALIAVGLAIHERRGGVWPIGRLRDALTGPLLRRLAELQPISGGFLEAPPLTAFVGAFLSATGRAGHAVARETAGYLRSTQRADGAWAIDADLGTWVTTQAVAALAAQPEGVAGWLDAADRRALREALQARQERGPAVYTASGPGGWSWTPRPGGVPDADDSAGALLALAELGDASDPTRQARRRGAGWLMGLQNADGGWPTFCRGWGHLPFDRSCADLTAHAVRALHRWRSSAGEDRRLPMGDSIRRGLGYLRRAQRPDGAFEPLWFGCETDPAHRNPTYGTARVAVGLAELAAGDMLRRATDWLARTRQESGWGAGPHAPPTVEETALAVEALACSAGSGLLRGPRLRSADHALQRGVAALLERTDGGRTFPAAPIGLYFSKLAYAEAVYPPAFAAAALGRAVAT